MNLELMIIHGLAERLPTDAETFKKLLENLFNTSGEINSTTSLHLEEAYKQNKKKFLLTYYLTLALLQNIKNQNRPHNVFHNWSYSHHEDNDDVDKICEGLLALHWKKRILFHENLHRFFFMPQLSKEQTQELAFRYLKHLSFCIGKKMNLVKGHRNFFKDLPSSQYSGFEEDKDFFCPVKFTLPKKYDGEKKRKPCVIL